jgi:hypothetical protein
MLVGQEAGERDTAQRDQHADDDQRRAGDTGKRANAAPGVRTGFAARRRVDLGRGGAPVGRSHGRSA